MDLLTQISDNITGMVEPYETVVTIDDPYGCKRVHRARHLALLDQLAEAIEPGGIGADGRRIPSSRSPARDDAIDRLQTIRTSVAVRLQENGVRLQRDVKANMRRLTGIAWGPGELSSLDYSVRLWLSWCRVLTGWDTPAFAPNVTCPACGTRGTLRIRLVEHTACCVAMVCDAVWDPTTIGILAEHVRGETGG